MHHHYKYLFNLFLYRNSKMEEISYKIYYNYFEYSNRISKVNRKYKINICANKP